MKLALVVDDNAVNRKLAVALLQRRGWQVVEADNGQIGLDRLSHQPFSLVLLDIVMPVLDGEATCRRIRAHAPWADLPVIAYTANATPAQCAHYLASGFSAVLSKPLTAAELEHALRLVQLE